MRAALALPVMAAACASSVPVPTEAFRAEVLSRTPTMNALAATSRYFGCSETEPGKVAYCEACDTTLHDLQEDGLIAYATHWEHKLTPWEQGGPLKVSVSGEAADVAFKSEGRSANDARALADQAIAWCGRRGVGNLIRLKDVIDTYDWEAA